MIALVAMTLLTAVLAAVFSSPDDKAITMARWAKADPNDVVATATGELAGTTTSATYGAPYNHAAEGQKVLGVPLQKMGGVRIPEDSQDLVLQPLEGVTGVPALGQALATWKSAPSDQQQCLGHGVRRCPGTRPAATLPLSRTVTSARFRSSPPGSWPWRDRAASRERSRRRAPSTGATRHARSCSSPTAPTSRTPRSAQHLGGDQWGMMNEVGNYPGQPWMWLYTFWYQVKPFSTSDNADVEVWALMMLLTLLLMFVPFIPGLRSIPRWIPVHRLVWREYYSTNRRT